MTQNRTPNELFIVWMKGAYAYTYRGNSPYSDWEWDAVARELWRVWDKVTHPDASVIQHFYGADDPQSFRSAMLLEDSYPSWAKE